MIIKPNGNSGQGVDLTTKPQIWFTGKWTGWYFEIYDNVPYWEALFETSGTLTAAHGYTCDAFGIGGGGAGGRYYNGSVYGTGAGSGYTNMAEGLTIPPGNTTVTIGAGGAEYASSANNGLTRTGSNGGATKFLGLTCNGGQGGRGETNTAGKGGSNGETYGASKKGGENGTPGDGKLMSKFWSAVHNTNYGAGGTGNRLVGPGGGGFMNVTSATTTSGAGFGGGGGGYFNDPNYETDSFGKDGCLIIRIKAA